jgi:hypothetical protein
LLIRGLLQFRSFSIGVYGGLETADAIPDSFAQLREFLGPEHEQGEANDHKQMHGLKDSFEHHDSSIQKNIRS